MPFRPDDASDDDDAGAGAGDAFEEEEPQMDTSMKQVHHLPARELRGRWHSVVLPGGR